MKAQLTLAGRPKCTGPACNKVIKDLGGAVFLIRNGSTVAFCGPECYYEASQLHLDQLRANRGTKKNLLAAMGYKYPSVVEGETSSP